MAETNKTTITPRDNGPYLVQGAFSIRSPDGQEIPTQGESVALCRCGGSTNKPFCDGTHSRIGFEAATRAVEEAQRKDQEGSA